MAKQSTWRGEDSAIKTTQNEKEYETETVSVVIRWWYNIITVCTVVQNCCNGRSKKYRKWHFWGCSLSETLQRIDITFGRDDYVGDESQYPKWHINRFRDVISAKGWNVNGLCFFLIFVRSLAPLGVKPLDRFWRVIRQNACFRVSCIPFGVRTMTSQL